MAKKLELKSLIGSEFRGSSPIGNNFSVITDGKERFFAVESYAPILFGNIFAFAHCYIVPLSDDTDRIIADVIYDGEIDSGSASAQVTFVNREGEVLYGIYAYEGRHEYTALEHYGKVYVREFSGTKVVGVEELV